MNPSPPNIFIRIYNIKDIYVQLCTDIFAYYPWDKLTRLLAMGRISLSFMTLPP